MPDDTQLNIPWNMTILKETTHILLLRRRNGEQGRNVGRNTGKGMRGRNIHLCFNGKKRETNQEGDMKRDERGNDMHEHDKGVREKHSHTLSGKIAWQVRLQNLCIH